MFMPYQKTSDEESPVHFLAFALQLSFRLINMSKKISDRLSFMRVNERNYLQCDCSKANRTALSKFGRLTPHQEESD